MAILNARSSIVGSIKPTTLLTIALLMAILLSGMTAFSVMAAAPSEGTVVEGESVPGFDLGASRAQVEAAIGAPRWCQDVDLSGDLAYCSYPVDGGGAVDVRYRGSDGRYASNSPDDIVFFIRWSQQVSGWTTTAGVNTALALSDREAVAAAYPNAEVTYDGLGQIASVEDPQLGILVKWSFDSYTHTTSVYMAIYNPVTSTLPDGSSIHVSNLELTTDKHRSIRHVLAVISVQGEQGQPVSGASVVITWIYPNGALQTVTHVSSETGYAFFELNDVRQHGVYSLTVDDVVLEGHPFDRENSLLTSGVKVK